jgi:RHS repeat-associated protein
VGNRLSSLGVSPYSVNTSNELTAIPGTTYTYDDNGNILTKVTSSGTATYGWDFENRLTSLTLPGTGGTLSFKYDGLGRRIQKAFTQGSTTTTTNYLYDGNNAVADVDQNGNVLARYAMTQNIDEPLAELRASTTSYYSQDGLGSVTSLTTSAGALGNTYTYDSFGNLTASTGSIANRFQYTGRELDPETGLYFYRARYYDPATGRFVSEDPLRFYGNDVNFYRYVWDSVPNLKDPLGLWGVGATVGASAFAGGGPGIGGSQTWGGMYFPSTNTSGGYMSTGAFAGCHSPFGNYQNNNSGGLGASAGPGITFTNANSIQGLGGPFNTTTYYLGPVSVEFSYSGGTWTLNISAGGGGGLGYAQNVTDTFTNPVSPASFPLPSGSHGCGCQ